MSSISYFHHANGNCIVVEQKSSVMTFKSSSPSSNYQTIRGDDANPKAMPKRLKLKLPISSLGNYVKEVLITSKSQFSSPTALKRCQLRTCMELKYNVPVIYVNNSKGFYVSKYGNWGKWKAQVVWLPLHKSHGTTFKYLSRLKRSGWNMICFLSRPLLLPNSLFAFITLLCWLRRSSALWLLFGSVNCPFQS